MRTHRTAGVTAGVILILLATSCGGPKVHRDGEGVLSALGDPEGNLRVVVERRPGITTWSFGVPLCLELPGASAILHSVMPAETIGSGFELVGVSVHEVADAGRESTIGSQSGYPPEDAPILLPLKGYTVNVECGPFPERATELIVGLAVTGADGGGLKSLELSYSVGDEMYVVVSHHEMLICGDSVAELCEGPTPS